MDENLEVNTVTPFANRECECEVEIECAVREFMESSPLKMTRLEFDGGDKRGEDRQAPR